MNLIDMKITEFLDELASKSPAPGGGSVSALAGANATSLALMVSELTINKKKFKALPETIQKDYLETIKIFKQNRELFIKYIDEDTLAFNEIMAAFKLPKETESEIAKRNEAIQKATIVCIKVPMQVCLSAMECLRNIEALIKHSNKNAISDLGVATLLTHSAFEGASMNVMINLQGLEDEALKKDYHKVIEKMSEEAKTIKEDILEEIYFLMK